VVREGEVRRFLDPLPVGRIWGVGPVAEARLRAAGVETVGALAHAAPRLLERALGDFGLRFAALARGEDLREVEPSRAAVSISEENTFARDVADARELEAAILTHAETVARRLRRSGLLARTVVLKIKLAGRRSPGPRGFPLLTRRATLAEPTDDGEEVARTARALLVRAAPPEPVRLVGVGVTNLLPGDGRQLGLFGAPAARARRARLNRALDVLAERFGAEAVRRGSQADVSRAGLSLRIKRGAEDDGARGDRTGRGRDTDQS